MYMFSICLAVKTILGFGLCCELYVKVADFVFIYTHLKPCTFFSLLLCECYVDFPLS